MREVASLFPFRGREINILLLFCLIIYKQNKKKKFKKTAIRRLYNAKWSSKSIDLHYTILFFFKTNLDRANETFRIDQPGQFDLVYVLVANVQHFRPKESCCFKYVDLFVCLFVRTSVRKR